MLQDLVLNLVSEAIGIIITVIIVDRLLERQRRRLWLPTKHQIYSKLFNTLEEFFIATRIHPSDKKEIGAKAYRYGKTTVIGSGSYRGVGFSQVLESIETDYKFVVELGLEHKPTDLSSLRSQVSVILDTSLPLLEPEILELLLELDNSIMTFNRLSPRSVTPTPDEASDIVYMLSDVISKAISVRTYLEQKVDNVQPVEQYLDEVVEKAKIS